MVPQYLLENKYFATVMMILTFYALFGEDVRLSTTEKPADDIFYGLR